MVVTTVSVQPSTQATHRKLIEQIVLALGALAIMLAFIGTPPVTRTQEARVLETAREMIGRPWHEWLIPHLNGEMRLEKPPMAYWLSAIGYEIGGVNEIAGRVPIALFGWGTVLLTYATAAWLFGRRAGYLSSAALFGGMMFARHARLAETDILATFFVTGAIASIMRAHVSADLSMFARGNWFRLSGIALGCAVMAKGLPAVFIGLFLIALAAFDRDWKLIWRWTISGAPILAIVVAAPWFIYLHETVGLATLRTEAEIGVRGMEHAGSFLQYFPDTLRGTLPWTALVVFAIAIACFRWREDHQLMMVNLWALVIFVALCVARQRQFHYLLPMMPALAILTGAVIEDALEERVPQRTTIDFLLRATLVGLVILALAAPIIGHRLRHWRSWTDVITVVLSLVAVVVTGVAIRRSLSRAMIVFGIASIVLMTWMVQVWMPSLHPENPRAVARQIRSLGPRPCYFYGENISLPLLFYMKQTMPTINDPDALVIALAEHPDLLLIEESKANNVAPAKVPAAMNLLADIPCEDQHYRVYEFSSQVASR
jgi:4-amino-4-deoxy-L-arabinose transferase-like glycosyltransferase